VVEKLLNKEKNELTKTVILFSGGQDSTTCLYWALNNLYPNLELKHRRDYIKLLSFDYGQRHSIELAAAKKIAEMSGLDLNLLNVRHALGMNNSLTSEKQSLTMHDDLEAFSSDEIPNTFVPARNMLFLTLAASFAYEWGAMNIVTGVCETDYAGYYDCRLSFIKSMEETMNLALFGKPSGISIHTPLMYLTKADTVRLSAELGDECLEALAYSHTCYSGVFPPCGKCHSCHLRARGFKEAALEDPLIKRALSLN
jgi:7-cyano-7-deazaguanine synthase